LYHQGSEPVLGVRAAEARPASNGARHAAQRHLRLALPFLRAPGACPRARSFPDPVVHLRGRIGLLTAAKAPPEEIEQARAELAEALLESRIAKLIETAPPLAARSAPRLSEWYSYPGECPFRPAGPKS
jgi:hypothetical protein